MRSIRQTILSIKIEHHWRRAKQLEKRIGKTTNTKKEKLSATINLHRYMVEKTLFEYEILAGLRNSNGIWKGLREN